MARRLKKDKKFVAADPIDEVGRGGGGEPARGDLQQTVADMMTVGVVDRLEVIEIERDQPPGPRTLAAKPRERRVERRTVREPGQFVVRCSIFALGGQRMALERDRAKVETGLRHGDPSGIGVARPVAIESQNADDLPGRSEEHTSELQSLMRISYAVF